MVIGLQGGARAELDLRALQLKRASVHATTLRSRPLAEKAAIVAEVREHVWPLVEAGKVTAGDRPRPADEGRGGGAPGDRGGRAYREGSARHLSTGFEIILTAAQSVT